jgi:uncharacterized Ntn-hydrolase superfamily protein
MISASGNQAVHTGRHCIREAGHVMDDNFIVMANLMEKNTVWQAMADAFRNSPGDLAERMMAALEAAQAEGGDIRGRQSAAMVIVRGTSTGADYNDRIVDLRIDDNPNPLRELRRLITLNRAYLMMNEGDEKMVAQDMQGAMEAYNRAMELAPDVTEIKYWTALTMFAEGLEIEALEIFTEVFAREPVWADVTRRLPAAGLLINDAGELDRILSVAPE